MVGQEIRERTQVMRNENSRLSLRPDQDVWIIDTAWQVRRISDRNYIDEIDTSEVVPRDSQSDGILDILVEQELNGHASLVCAPCICSRRLRSSIMLGPGEGAAAWRSISVRDAVT
jgi:hypothetical protein